MLLIQKHSWHFLLITEQYHRRLNDVVKGGLEFIFSEKLTTVPLLIVHVTLGKSLSFSDLSIFMSKMTFKHDMPT